MGGYGDSGNPYDGASGCTVDGQPMDCSFAARLVSTGAAGVCPDNRCRPGMRLTHEGWDYGETGVGGGGIAYGVVDARTGAGWQKRSTPRQRRSDQRPQRRRESKLPPGTQTWPDDGGPNTAPVSREEAARCDEILKKLFTKKGSGAIAAGSGFNPTTLKNDPAQERRGYNDQTFRPHIWSAMHIWPTNTGQNPAAPVGLYIPEGVGRGQTKLYSAAHGRYDTFYEQLGNLKNVTLITSHVGNFKVNTNDRNDDRSIRIGTLGGPGGESRAGLNVHSHLSIMTSDGRLVSFYDAFCR